MEITKTGEPLQLTITPIQETVFEDPHKIVLFAKGRRAGGTTGAVNFVIEKLLEGKSILWVDTIQANLSAYWDRYFLPIISQIKSQYWKWNEQKKELHLLQGLMVMRSAERPENIEGFAYHIIICNEAGIIFLPGDALWYNTLAPMTLDYCEKVVMVGTPKGKLNKKGTEHLFFTFWKKGCEISDEYKSYQVTSYANPFLKADDIKHLEEEIPAAIREQEINAQFVNIGTDELFKEAWWVFIEALPEAFKIKRKILSADTAFKDTDTADYSAITYWLQTIEDKFICADCYVGHWNFPDLIDRTQSIYDRYTPDMIVIEDKASGSSLIQMFQKTTLPVFPFKSDKDKVSRAISITPLVERGRVQLLKGKWNKQFIDQHSLFPAGENDDIVDSSTQGLIYLSGSVPLVAQNYRSILSKRVVHDPIESDIGSYHDVAFNPRTNKSEKVTTNFW
jgi:predicted phage terminase large subunit-like protein